MFDHLKRNNNLTLPALFSRITFLLSCLPLITPTHMMSMQHSQELISYEVTSLTNLPKEIAIIVAANCEVQDSLRETCRYFDELISQNKKTILKHGLLQLNAKALTKFLVLYGSLGNRDIVHNLLKKGANPNAYDNRISWMYNTACNFTQKVADGMASHLESYKITKSFVNEPLLLIVISNGYNDIAQLLIDYAADVTIKGNYGQTALHRSSKNGNDPIVKILLDNEANSHINGRDRYGMTPLHYACVNGFTSIIKMLLAQGANIHKTTDLEQSVLHCASTNNHHKAVTLLLQNGANIDALDTMNNTPLHFACIKGHVQTIKVLLKNGANINLMNLNEKRPLDLVPYQFNLSPCDENVHELLIKNGGQYGPFMTASRTVNGILLVFLPTMALCAYYLYLLHIVG